MPAERIEQFQSLAPEAEFVVRGGNSRTESVRAGIDALPSDVGYVAIHDAARPFAKPDLIELVIQKAREVGAAFPALPVSDTLRQHQADGWRDLDRGSIVRVQTPQVIRRDWITQALAPNQDSTDDIAAIIAHGFPAESVPGDPANVKITVMADLPQESEIRTGFGYDVHRFSSDPDRPLWLGGIEFDDRPGLEGHSDADALIHAIVDALLGAAGEGDIGVHYPPSDERWKNCPSRRFLAESALLLRSQGWHIINIDATVVAERPRVMPRSLEIRRVLAESLELDIARVSVKATTNEKLGAIGNSEGIACYAVATIRR